MLEKNLATLKQNHPDLAAQVSAYKRDPQVRIGTIKTIEREIDIILGPPDRHLLYYNHISPIEKTQREVDEKLNPIKSAKIIIQFGFGLGYETFALSKHIARLNTTTVLIIEKSMDIFMQAMENIDLTPLFSMGGLRFIVGKAPHEIFASVYHWISSGEDLIRIASIEALVTQGASINLEYMEIMRSVVEAVNQNTISLGNSPFDSLQGMHNFLLNIDTVIENPGLVHFANQFKGIPALCISAGPSLDQHISKVSELLDHAIVIAADTCIAPLASRGIKPHITTAVERIDNVIPLFEGHDLNGVYLFNVPVLRPKVYQNPGIKPVSVYRNISHFAWSEVDRGTVSAGVSSGNLAFETAVALGCNPIIIIGQDFCFDSQGNSHVSGAYFGRKQVASQEGRVTIEGVDGGPRESRETWISFLRAFERQVETCPAEIINCSLGAKIQGTKHMSFDEVIKGLKSSSKPHFHRRAQKIVEDFHRLGTSSVKTKFEQIRRVAIEDCQGILHLLDEILSTDTPDAMVAMIQEMEQKYSKTWSMVLMHNVQAFHLKYMIEINEINEVGNDDLWIQITKDWTRKMINLVGMTLDVLSQPEKFEDQMSFFDDEIEEATRLFWPRLRHEIEKKGFKWELALVESKDVILKWHIPFLTLKMPLEPHEICRMLDHSSGRILIPDPHTIMLFKHAQTDW